MTSFYSNSLTAKQKENSYKEAKKVNIPNILTIFRLCLIPVYIAVFALEGDTKELAALVFIAASITDVLDGYIARKFDMITRTGQLLDPLADKLMQLTVVISLVISNILPVWFVVVLAVKELLLILGGVFLYAKKTYVKSNILGKLNTVVLFIAMVLMFFTHTSELVSNIILGISTVFNFMAIVSYFYSYFIKQARYKEYISKSNNGGA